MEYTDPYHQRGGREASEGRGGGSGRRGRGGGIRPGKEEATLSHRTSGDPYGSLSLDDDFDRYDANGDGVLDREVPKAYHHTSFSGPYQSLPPLNSPLE